MAIKAFLDTNIILDIFHRDRPFHKEAVDLFNHLDESKFTGYYSESVLTSMAYVLRKKMNSTQINRSILILNKKVNVLSCIPEDINKSLGHNPTDFEDALLYEIALRYQMDYFITSNLKDFKSFQNSSLPVINAKAFNKILANK